VLPGYSTMRRERRRTHVIAVLFVAAACSSLLGCGQQGTTTVSPSAPVTPGLTPNPAGSLKPILHGLLDRSRPPTVAFAGAVTAFVVNVNWADIEPTQGVLAANNPIDHALDQVRALNAAAHTSRYALKVRLFTGIHAPGWAKQLGGAPVTVTAQGVTGTTGRFWTPAFGGAYAAIWSMLAARYDPVPEIHEITVARCMTVFDETFVRGSADAATVTNLLDAGFTVAADHSCIQEEIALGKVWKTTRIGVAFNPYQDVEPSGRVSTDERFTQLMMSYCRVQLGPQCVLENNSIRFPPVSGPYEEMYLAMQQLGPPISFQTATLGRVGDLLQTLQWAAQLGADAVELPTGYDATAPSVLTPFASRLATNPG
jgi:hypothetical protein